MSDEMWDGCDVTRPLSWPEKARKAGYRVSTHRLIPLRSNDFIHPAIGGMIGIALAVGHLAIPAMSILGISGYLLIRLFLRNLDIKSSWTEKGGVTLTDELAQALIADSELLYPCKIIAVGCETQHPKWMGDPPVIRTQGSHNYWARAFFDNPDDAVLARIQYGIIN
jgi:hypothetical protein